MIAVFGDSFAKTFSLFKDSRVKVYSFKGATMKGLAKRNENRKKIESILKNNRHVQCAIFIFGQVDLNLSYYYDLVGASQRGEVAFNSQYSQFISAYVDWVNYIPGKFKRIICAPFPSPLDQTYTLCSLVNYGSVGEDQLRAEINKLTDHSTDIDRKTRYFEFIYALKLKVHKSKKITNIEYIEFNNHVLGPNLYVLDKYMTPNKFSFHLQWGPLITPIINELNAIGVRLDNSDIVDDMADVESKYLNQKTIAAAENDKKYAQLYMDVSQKLNAN